MYNERLLRSKITFNEMSLEKLADSIGINPSTLQRKLKTGNFIRDEIARIASTLSLSDEETMDIFFADELE